MYRNGSVGLDELGHHAAESLDTERKRSNVEKKHVLHVTGKHTTLNSSTDSHYLIRVDALVRLLAEEVLDKFLNLRNTG